jgi:hypothetical protein
MNAAQLNSLAQSLAQAAAIFNPTLGIGLSTVIAVATSLNELLAAAKSNDPEAWAKIAAQYPEALRRFEESQPKAPPDSDG